MEVDGVMMPRPRIPEGAPSPGAWDDLPPLPTPPAGPGLEDWPEHLELLEVAELAALLASKDGTVPPALLGAVCSRIEALSGGKAPARLQQRRVYTHDWLERHSDWTPPVQGLASPPGSARRQSAPPTLTALGDGGAPDPPTPGGADAPLSDAEADLIVRITASLTLRLRVLSAARPNRPPGAPEGPRRAYTHRRATRPLKRLRRRRAGFHTAPSG